MSVKIAKKEHEVAYADLCALVNKHADKLSAMELLAIASNMLGKLIAMQDQRKISPDMAMEVVAQNIELGNQQIMALIANSKGSA